MTICERSNDVFKSYFCDRSSGLVLELFDICDGMRERVNHTVTVLFKREMTHIAINCNTRFYNGNSFY